MWYFSATATLLYVSYILHNIIAWIKIKPFLSKTASNFYIVTVVLVTPYWIVESYALFVYFSGQSRLFAKTRSLEAIFRSVQAILTKIFCQILTPS